jgi:hypothetical protein
VIQSGWAFASLSGATACQQNVDVSLGYPKAGSDVGKGTHVPPQLSITVTYFTPLTLAGLTYYVSDQVTQPLLLPNAVPLGLGVAAPIPYPSVVPATVNVGNVGNAVKS